MDVEECIFRAGSATSTKEVAIGYKRARVTATGNGRSGWIEFSIGGVKGRMPRRFLTAIKPTPDPTRVWTTEDSLALRSGPGNNYAVKKTVPAGTKGVFQNIRRNGWRLIKFGDTYAWTFRKKVSVGGFYDRDAILSLAHSQVGYREPAWQTNKFNTWIGGSNAWCSVFVSWVFDHTDFAAGVPKRDRFKDYVADLRKAGVLDTTPKASELQKGDVVLVDLYPYDGPTHTGIVDHVAGDYVWLVEGNTLSGTGDKTRGVFYRKRALVNINAVYDPWDYAWETR
ncbi:CHAP domain-containing protein [Demequina subtropica]|uniref:CHAP domain-containing protein n=1 Tax=Demequina subtropica TaxID=1638989 RepID=UPI000786793C|nr:CHAP domain-containing protein [Demequina subtropica]